MTSAGRRLRPAVPTGIVIILTPDGWRHSFTDERGGRTCGRLRVPAGAGAEEARAAATDMLTVFARDVHGLEVEVRWAESDSQGAWTAEVHHSPPSDR